MGELVGYGNQQESIERNPVLRQQLAASLRISPEQRFFQKDLPLLEDREGRASGIATDAAQDPLPVLGPDENPRPVTERRQIHPGQHVPQAFDVSIAVRLAVASVAVELKAWC
jgi:hypothetical protein